jgi:DGQHR domain-containing protein
MLTVECLQQTVASGPVNYPVYVGFLPAADIARVAEAPSFQVSTPHETISKNIVSQPVRDWQRPVDKDRLNGIAHTFDNTGNLMPNPVLLGQNAFVNGAIQISPKTLANSPTLTGTYEVKIDDSQLTPGQKPLWILDGQHRIAGLDKSAQRHNPVPVVFLLDGGSGAYTSPLLAGLFAQVTTSATKLDELHNEWLTFAFGLDSYVSSKPKASEYHKAFEAVATLCREPSYQNSANPFYNAIAFNQHQLATPTHGGFVYKCTTLKDLLFRYYYNQPAVAPHMAPEALAGQLSLAYSALYAVVGSQADTVFFGPKAKQQEIIQDAYFIGVCARLLKSGVPADWRAVLLGLKFDQTIWDFSWVRSLSGPANTASKKIAIDVLSDALTSGNLPGGSSNLADHLKGNGAKATITFSPLTPQGRPKRNGKVELEVLRGSTETQQAHSLPHMKVTDMSSNIGRLEVHDASVRGRPLIYRDILGRGMVLDSSLSSPLSLILIMHHYGDLSNNAELTVIW